MHPHFNLKYVPFSRCGSYLAISDLSKEDYRDAGLYLRSIHAQAGQSEFLRILPEDESDMTYDYTPAKLTIHYSGTAEIIFAEEDTLRIRGKGTGLKLFNHFPQGKHIIELDENRYVFQMGTPYIQMGIRMLSGRMEAEQDWNGQWSPHISFTLLPDEKGEWECELHEYKNACYPLPKKTISFDLAAKRVQQAFDAYCENTPEVPEGCAALRTFAAYVNWSSIVAPRGINKRYAMLMSKNWMCNVWSWDHCFNALALADGDPDLAWDQLMGSFDHADENGALPDLYNDAVTTRLNVKPPVHGWALSRMMEHHTFSTPQLEEAYTRLAAWTNWWTQLRAGKNGMPYYYHGNDSGWDNATAFLPVMPVSSPDLVAFLIVQMRTLARLAERLGKTAEMKEWDLRADAYKKALVEKYWNGKELLILDGKGNGHATTSLLPLMVILLGEELPEELREYVVSTLLKPADEGGFLTKWGLATEQPNSPYYLPDGYWLGPIWAPSTLICADGLTRLGYRDEARMLAEQFVFLCNEGGFAENFNALTGEGLRDRAYTWTSSVFLTLCRDYL